MKKYLLSLVLLGTYSLNAQTVGETIEKLGKSADINLYLRSSLEMHSNESVANGIKVNEARLEIMGDATENLSYRFRARMNRTVAAGTQDNVPSSIDYAYITYKFGEEKKWSVTIGKQMNNIGSWEFRDNPTFDYQYSHFVTKQQNLFPVGLQVSYNVNPKYSLHLQAFNTVNDAFSTIYTKTSYDTNGLEASKTPFGLNLTWIGKMFEDKFQTIYTLTTSQVAKGESNFQVSLGNKVVLDKFTGVVDVSHTNMAVDYVNMISPSINGYYLAQNPNYVSVYAQDLVFQTLGFRFSYAVTPNWFITAKTVFERIEDKNNLNVGKNLSTNNVNYLGLEFKPFDNQDFKLFGYYAQFHTKYNENFRAYTPNFQNNIVAIGALWYLNVL